MKKVIQVMVLLFSLSLWANSLDIKIGAAGFRDKILDVNTGEEKREWNTGFDGALSFNLIVDKLLAVAPEVGIARFSKSESATPMQGMKMDYEQVTYLLPFLINARLFLPMGELGMGEKPLFQPYVTVGLGYTAGEVQVETTTTSTGSTSTTKSKYGLNGFTYQAFLGSAITLDPTSAVEALVEIGYRGANLKPDLPDFKATDYPTWVARVGIRYSFGVASSY